MLRVPLLQEGEATGLGALGVDLGAVVAYLINFGLLLVILYFLAYKPLLRVLDARSQRIKESLEQADRVRREALEQQAQLQQRLDEGRQEGQRILQEAREAAERYREQQQVTARAQAEEMLVRARTEIQAERDSAIEQVRAQFSGLAVSAAERIIRRSLDPATHRDLIDQVLADSDVVRGQG